MSNPTPSEPRPLVGKLHRPPSGLQRLRPKPKPGAAVRNQRRWKTMSRWYRSQHPLCERCGENLSDEVHHRIRVAEAPHLAFAVSNLEALCRACHAAIHGKRSRFTPLDPRGLGGDDAPPAPLAPSLPLAPPPQTPETPPRSAVPLPSMYEPTANLPRLSMYEPQRGPYLGPPSMYEAERAAPPVARSMYEKGAGIG
jgi:hypothetical protein